MRACRNRFGVACGLFCAWIFASSASFLLSTRAVVAFEDTNNDYDTREMDVLNITSDPSKQQLQQQRQVSKQPQNASSIMVLDLRDLDYKVDSSPTVFAIQTCVGLFNRNVSLEGAAYTVWRQADIDWLREIESMVDPEYMSIDDFLGKCLTTVARRRYIHYNFDKQQIIVPNLVTLAGVLDAVPLIQTNETLSWIETTKATMVFDAETIFAGFSPYDATLYMFQNHAHQTTTMAKSDPGYNFDKIGKMPPLTRWPSLRLADYIVKERLFNFFLLSGCIPLTKEHALMETMTRPNQPNTSQWPQPIAVFGYDDASWGAPGAIFEAETTCVKEHNMGQVATCDATNLAFWSRKPPIETPLRQNRSPPDVYNASTTYIAFVIGDGDNVAMVQERNYDWAQRRLANCQNVSLANNCFPISWTMSPHMLYAAPDILNWFYAKGQATGRDYFLLPPSGYLYAYPAMMNDKDQATFVSKTEEASRLLNSSGTVDWEFSLTWKGAIKSFFPRFAAKNVVRGLFAVNVPFNVPVFSFFRRREFYKIIHDKAKGGGAVVLFRPREWRGTSGKGDVPFSQNSYLTEKKMAAEVNKYPRGTVCYIYLTSDGGFSISNLYKMIPYLDSHVKVVSHETVTEMALQRSERKGRGAASAFRRV